VTFFRVYQLGFVLSFCHIDEHCPKEEFLQGEILPERESNASILIRFELTAIGRYFPEYGRTIR